ncbi:MAG: TadE/TadG family type IV pilus assembly protein, partial [Anaerolineales bacterium]
MGNMPANPTSEQRSRRKSRGQTAVEFALVLPIMLIVIFVIIEIARVLAAWLAVENGARFGVRYAVTGDYNDLYCGPAPGFGFPGDVCDDDSEKEAVRIPSIEDVAKSGSVSILRNDLAAVGQPGFFQVTVCSSKTLGGAPLFQYHDPIQSAHTPAWCEDIAAGVPIEDAGGPGDRVSVTVDFEHPLITPIVSSWWPNLHLSARREGIVEQFRVARVVGLPATISVPTFTPTQTYTPTVTSTVTQTGTPTTTA